MIHELSLLESKSYFKKYNSFSEAQIIMNQKALKLSPLNFLIGPVEGSSAKALARATLGAEGGTELCIVPHYGPAFL